jgi:hypothetical protein
MTTACARSDMRIPCGRSRRRRPRIRSTCHSRVHADSDRDADVTLRTVRYPLFATARTSACAHNTGDQLQGPTQRQWRGGSEHDRRDLLQEVRRALSAASPRWAAPPRAHALPTVRSSPQVAPDTCLRLAIWTGGRVMRCILDSARAAATWSTWHSSHGACAFLPLSYLACGRKRDKVSHCRTDSFDQLGL